MKKRTILIFGGSFNPPGIHHEKLAQVLSQHFDEVFILPCGPRPDKDMQSIETYHRTEMVKLSFHGTSNIKIDLSDTQRESFSTTKGLDRLFKSQGKVWHLIGTDRLQGVGSSQSYRQWKDGELAWNSCNFAVVSRPGYPIIRSDLPPNHKLFEMQIFGSSSTIRERLQKNKTISGLVNQRVHEYIMKNKLYGYR